VKRIFIKELYLIIIMKILVFTDLHNSERALDSIKKAIKDEKIDLILNCGDFTVFGDTTPHIMKRFDKLGAPMIMVHGNHEDLHEVEAIAKTLKNVTLIHKKVFEQGKLKIVGYGGEGFRKTCPEFETFMEKVEPKINKDDLVIFMLHQPPYGGVVDVVWGDQHTGNTSFTKWIKKMKPALVFSGHIHETIGQHEKWGKTIIINPGPFGAVIELNV